MNLNDIKFIAEIGSNHNQSWDRCEKLIRSASNLGFNAVKFQLFKAKLMYHNKKKQKELKKQDLPLSWISKISKLCKELNIEFGCTPFYLDAIDKLKSYVDFFKISSFDAHRVNLIINCLKTNLPVYISCGILLDEEIKKMVLNLSYLNLNNYKLFHCISEYPSKINDLYLNRLDHSFLNGYSDHSICSDAILTAIFLGARIIELHFDLDDQKGVETKYGHCWTETKIALLFARINRIKNIIGEEKQFKPSESGMQNIADSLTGFRD